MHTMSKPSFSVQAKFKFYTDDETLAKEWKHSAKINASQTTFLEGMLLKKLDTDCKYILLFLSSQFVIYQILLIQI